MLARAEEDDVDTRKNRVQLLEPVGTVDLRVDACPIERRVALADRARPGRVVPRRGLHEPAEVEVVGRAVGPDGALDQHLDVDVGPSGGAGLTDGRPELQVDVAARVDAVDADAELSRPHNEERRRPDAQRRG